MRLLARTAQGLKFQLQAMRIRAKGWKGNFIALSRVLASIQSSLTDDEPTAAFGGSLSGPRRQLSGRHCHGRPGPVRHVVLVHDAFADGSGWMPVADILRKDAPAPFPPMRVGALQQRIGRQTAARRVDGVPGL